MTGRASGDAPQAASDFAVVMLEGNVPGCRSAIATLGRSRFVRCSGQFGRRGNCGLSFAEALAETTQRECVDEDGVDLP
jgi:hypothetical protein